jgi:hypothetical protein
LDDIDELTLQKVNFDFIRECVNQLKLIVDEFGPFREVSEVQDGSRPNRDWDDDRGWVCDDLKNFDSRLIWTEWCHNGEDGELQNGYQHDHAHIESWYIASKPFDSRFGLPDSAMSFLTFGITESDIDETLGSRQINLFDLLAGNELSNDFIVSKMDWND